jgi:putative transposase
MTRSEVKPSIAAVQELIAQAPDGLREIVRSVMQAMLEAEMGGGARRRQGRAHGEPLPRSGFMLLAQRAHDQNWP